MHNQASKKEIETENNKIALHQPISNPAKLTRKTSSSETTSSSSILSNIKLLLASPKHSSMANVKSLSCALLLMLSSLPSIISKEYSGGAWALGELACYYTSYVVDVSKLTCPYFALAMAVDRLLTLKNLEKNQTALAAKRRSETNVLSCVIWVISLMMGLLSFPFVKYETFYEYTSNSNNSYTVELTKSRFWADVDRLNYDIYKDRKGAISLSSSPPRVLNLTIGAFAKSESWSMCYKAFPTNEKSATKMYLLLAQILFNIIIGSLIPSIVIFITSVTMVISVRKKYKNGSLSTNLQKRLKRINNMVIFLIVSFMLCWLPNAASNAALMVFKLNNLGIVGEYCWSVRGIVMQIMHSMSQFILFSYTIAHPLAVLYCNSQYRTQVYRWIGACGCGIFRLHTNRNT